MTQTRTPSQLITESVTSWPGVEAGLGERGEFGFTVGGRQIGHLHGDRVAHFGFPRSVGARLREEGRVEPHPVSPENPGWAGHPIRGDDDVHAVIELMRLNYDRVVTRHGVPGIRPSAPHALPFAPDLHVRSFLIERPAGDVILYGAPDRHEGATRRYLNHWHEAMFLEGDGGPPLFVNEHDRAETEQRAAVAHVFSKRHTLDGDLELIPTPGHTPGATAFLWEGAGRRMLFTGDSLYLRDGEWVAAVLDSSDRAAYLESLELIAELDFDVLVPWAASAGQPWFAETDRANTRRRVNEITKRLRSGQNH
jgi:hypothetical protein